MAISNNRLLTLSLLNVVMGSIWRCSCDSLKSFSPARISEWSYHFQCYSLRLSCKRKLHTFLWSIQIIYLNICLLKNQWFSDMNNAKKISFWIWSYSKYQFIFIHTYSNITNFLTNENMYNMIDININKMYLRQNLIHIIVNWWHAYI